MPIKPNIIKITIFAMVAYRIMGTTTEGIIMRNDRSITLEDAIGDITVIIITGRIPDTIIITTTIITFHTVPVFGFFGGATRARWGFQSNSNFFESLALQPALKSNMLRVGAIMRIYRRHHSMSCSDGNSNYR
jgi:hypothetical protein